MSAGPARSCSGSAVEVTRNRTGRHAVLKRGPVSWNNHGRWLRIASLAESTLAVGANLGAGLQRARKLLLWLSAWLKRIARGAIGGYKEPWATSATIWHTTRSGTILKDAASSHLPNGRGRRRGERSCQDIGDRSLRATSSAW